jgi:hypothetical protein
MAFMIFFVGMACIIVLPSATRTTAVAKPQATLPDGRIVRIEKVTFHGGHEWRTGPRWKQKLQASLPKALGKLLGPEVKTFRPHSRASNTVVWLSIDLRKGLPSPIWGGFKIISEGGEKFDGSG